MRVRSALAVMAGFGAAVLATMAMVLAVSAVLSDGRILLFFDDSVPVALVKLASAVAMVAAPGWILARGVMGVVGVRAPWAFAIAGAATAMLGLALLPSMPFSFGIMGMGAVAGVVAGLVERGIVTMKGGA